MTDQFCTISTVPLKGTMEEIMAENEGGGKEAAVVAGGVAVGATIGGLTFGVVGAIIGGVIGGVAAGASCQNN